MTYIPRKFVGYDTTTVVSPDLRCTPFWIGNMLRQQQATGIFYRNERCDPKCEGLMTCR